MNRSMLKNGRNHQASCGAYMGCSCHNSKNVRRAGKKGAKQAERRAWRKENNC